MSPMAKALVIAGFFLVAAVAANAEERSVGPFSKLRVRNGIDIYLTQSDRETLTVKASDPDKVVTEVVNGELRISRATGGRSFFGGAKDEVHVGFVELSAIDASGGSDVKGRSQIQLEDLAVTASGGSDIDLDLQAKHLDVTLSGGSDLRLRGNAESVAIEASGGSDVSAAALQARQVKLRVSGGSDARINAKEAIDISASGGSDVSVSGNPQRRTVNNDRSSDVYWR